MIDTLRFMHTMLLGLDAKRRSEEGATAVEYGLMVALIAAVIVGVVAAIGSALNTKFGVVNTKLNS
jgi:pilus assembly protein Flp/PilA